MNLKARDYIHGCKKVKYIVEDTFSVWDVINENGNIYVYYTTPEGTCHKTELERYKDGTWCFRYAGDRIKWRDRQKPDDVSL